MNTQAQDLPRLTAPRMPQRPDPVDAPMNQVESIGGISSDTINAMVNTRDCLEKILSMMVGPRPSVALPEAAKERSLLTDLKLIRALAYQVDNLVNEIGGSI